MEQYSKPESESQQTKLEGQCFPSHAQNGVRAATWREVSTLFFESWVFDINSNKAEKLRLQSKLESVFLKKLEIFIIEIGMGIKLTMFEKSFVKRFQS